jgi:hypothetical protein
MGVSFAWSAAGCIREYSQRTDEREFACFGPARSLHAKIRGRLSAFHLLSTDAMNATSPTPLKSHWFFLLAPLIIAGDLYVGLTQRAEVPRLVEAGLLFDLAILLPVLFWACYRHQGRKAVVRAVALSCLGIWASSKLIPLDEQVLLAYVAPLRYVGLAVLIWIELTIVMAIWRAVFKGKSAQEATASIAADQDMPPWVARLLAWEAKIWFRIWQALKRLIGRD